jgi:cysteine-rich repeat protein
MYVCGDGVLDPRCEECDDGTANSDTAPDACRMNCRLPHCGDGTTDSGEGCDNGGLPICDGCDESCQVVVGLACGDGIVVPGCADECDDANVIAGDGCAPDCTLERVRGGGRTATDCYTEWAVNNPANEPLLDLRGGFSRKQSCVDDDPQCDFDGGTPGSCAFRIRVCANNTDVPGCTPPTQLRSWDLVSPSAARATRNPALAQVRASFAGVADAILGSAVDVCSTFIDVVVPMRGASAPYGPGKLSLKSSATSSVGVRDRDGLKLFCLPPS